MVAVKSDSGFPTHERRRRSATRVTSHTQRERTHCTEEEEEEEEEEEDDWI